MAHKLQSWTVEQPTEADYSKGCPKEGQIIYNNGFEFTAHNVRIIVENGKRILRYTGKCTDDPRNDSIRRTIFNGGGYGHLL